MQATGDISAENVYGINDDNNHRKNTVMKIVHLKKLEKR